MKHIFLVLFLLLFIFSQGYSQLIPTRNEDSLIIHNKVKSCSTFLIDEKGDKSHLIQKLEYDSNGQLMKEYLLSLWDVVSYSHTNSYSYNSKGQVLEILKMQEILNLYPKDQDYIESFGDMPVNEKIVFAYDEAGPLTMKEIFVFHTENFERDSLANQTLQYEYKDGKLILEKSSSPEIRVFNQNYSIQYDYDPVGNLIRKIRTFGAEKPMTRETRFVFDSVGQITEKVVIDKSAPHNNSREKFDYDSLGRMSKLFIYSKEEQEFVLETTYQYDEHGQMISGDRDVQYEYLENGLIKSESWQDIKTRQFITFSTQYEYF